jgi:Kef-type K+ transport system membrane component KefB
MGRCWGIRIAIFFVFAFTTVEKLRAPHETVSILQTELRLPQDLAVVALTVLIGVEVALALAWLVGWRLRSLATLTGILLVCFTMWLGYQEITKSTSRCGCGGSSLGLTVRQQRLVGIGRNVFLTSACALVRILAGRRLEAVS